MYRAYLVVQGKQHSVTAADVADMYPGCLPKNLTFVCERCGEKVSFFSGAVQAPHFRHRRNSTTAKDCELFFSAEAQQSAGNRSPHDVPLMPLYLEPVSASEASLYRMVVMAPASPASIKEWSELVGLQLTIDSLSQTRGGRRRTVAEITNPSDVLENRIARIPLEGRWSFPYMDRHNVFRKGTGRCRRLSRGGFVSPFREYLLVCRRGDIALVSTLPNFKRCGKIARFGRRGYVASEDYEVFRFSFDTDDPTDGARMALANLGLWLGDNGEEPMVLWPPSLCASGDVELLFSSERVVFTSAGAPEKPVGAFGVLDPFVGVESATRLHAKSGQVSVPRCAEDRLLYAGDSISEGVVLVGDLAEPAVAEGHPASLAVVDGGVRIDAAGSCDVVLFDRSTSMRLAAVAKAAGGDRLDVPPGHGVCVFGSSGYRGNRRIVGWRLWDVDEPRCLEPGPESAADPRMSRPAAFRKAMAAAGRGRGFTVAAARGGCSRELLVDDKGPALRVRRMEATKEVRHGRNR